MKKLITVIALAGAPLFMVSPDASAHDRYVKHHYHDQVRYRGHMPRWLRKQHNFRAWYFDSRLRYNTRLEWDELFSIYRWERRYSNRHRAHRYVRAHDRGFRYYRRYWSDERGYRDSRRYADKPRHHRKKRNKKRHH